jgi:hypothetical protein
MKGGSIYNGRMEAGVGVKTRWRINAGVLAQWRKDTFHYNNS